MKMKTRSIFFSLLLSALAFGLLSNCSGSKKEEAMQAHEDHSEKEKPSNSTRAESTEPQFTVDADFQKQLADVFKAYVNLKEGFVSSNVNKVKAEASKTQKALGKTDMKLLSGVAHDDWMNYLGGIESSLKGIQASADIEAQRRLFSTLSENLYKSIKAYGLGSDTAYYEFCPMAFDNEGAFWLSDAEQIRNPYFGDRMLSCGEVRETLK